MDSGGEDVDKIIETLDNSLALSAIVGVEPKLFPFCLPIYGHPTNGLFGFVTKLYVLSMIAPPACTVFGSNILWSKHICSGEFRSSVVFPGWDKL